MEKRPHKKTISSPNELNSYLGSTTIVTWILLFVVFASLAGFFAWCLISKITYKITGKATIQAGEVALVIEENRLSEVKVDQKVYIASVEGKVLSISESGQPVVSKFNLPDGEYDYTIVIKEIRPIEYFASK